jgi:cytochrome b6-f complex iron-sulfur subunit
VVDFGPYSSISWESRAIASEANPRSDADGPGRPVTRRNFIVWYLAGLLTATVVAVVAPILIFIYPPQGQTKNKDATITLDKALDALGNEEAVKFQSPAETGFVMKDGGGDNAPGKVAFSGYAVKDASGAVNVMAVNCSHLGCSVEFNADAKRFQCPCHGSQFNPQGQVVHGPAVYALSHLDWKPGASPNQIVIASYELKGIG